MHKKRKINHSNNIMNKKKCISSWLTQSPDAIGNTQSIKKEFLYPKEIPRTRFNFSNTNFINEEKCFIYNNNFGEGESIESILKKQEEEFEKILINKLQEQFEMFCTFNHNEINKRFDNTICSYIN